MISTVFLSLLLAASAYAFMVGRYALSMLLVVGFMQDIVRKLTPGEPIIFIVTVGVLFGAVLLGIWARKGFSYSLEPFARWTDQIRKPIMIFVLVLAMQLMHSIWRYNNVVVGVLGLLTYIAPFLAIIAGYYLVNTVEDIRRFMMLYVFSGVVVAASVVLSFVGYEWTILNEVGVGLKIYDQGTVLKSHAGIMRTGEVAAWHISTAACLVMALAMSSPKRRSFLIVLLIVGALMLAVALTGRRKMLMLTSLFIALYFVAFYYYSKTLDSKYFLGLFYTAIVLWMGFELISIGNYSQSLGNYIARSTTVFSDASSRFIDLGIAPIQWAYKRLGLMGGGLGIASQGAHLFDMENVAGGSGEGGLGKIMVELGLPGLICIAWLVIVITRYVNRLLSLSSQRFVSQPVLPLMLSLTVFLAVNAVTFSVATQVYGDFFILILLGIFGGFVFALPKIVINSLATSQSSTDRIAHAPLSRRPSSGGSVKVSPRTL
jgi:hypothetical protein